MSILAQSNCMQPRNSPESCQYNMPICDTAIQWHHLHSGRTLYYLQHSAGLIRDSSVDIASRLGGPNAVEIWTFPAGTRDFFPSVKHPDRLWCPSGLLSYRYPEGLCPSVKRPGPEEDQLSLWIRGAMPPIPVRLHSLHWDNFKFWRVRVTYLGAFSLSLALKCDYRCTMRPWMHLRALAVKNPSFTAGSWKLKVRSVRDHAFIPYDFALDPYYYFT